MTDQPWTIRQLPGENIILASLLEGYDMELHPNTSAAVGIGLLDQCAEQVFYIVDLRYVEMNINAMLSGTAATTSSAGALYRHPMIREVIFVTDPSVHDMFVMATQNLNSPQFGFIKARAMLDVDEALAYARAQL